MSSTMQNRVCPRCGEAAMDVRWENGYCCFCSQYRPITSCQKCASAFCHPCLSASFGPRATRPQFSPGEEEEFTV